MREITHPGPRPVSSINPGLIVRPRGKFQDLAEADHYDSYVGNNLALGEFDCRRVKQI